MRSADHYDPVQLSRYTVIHVYYTYPGERPEEKYFIILKHARETRGLLCWCLKATSRTSWYERDAEKIKGVILFPAGSLPFFTERTIVDPATLIGISHAHLQAESGNQRFRVAGKMPADFHGKLVNAITLSATIPPKDKKRLLALIDEVKP